MKIIIASDGSKFSESAIRFASRVMCEPNSEIMMVTVLEPAAGTELETIIESVDELIDPQNPEAQNARKMLERSSALLKGACGDKSVSISTKLLAGPSARAIVEEAERWRSDLIIVGSHGRGFWERAWLGSVSDRIVNHAPCSVLTVRDIGRE